MYGVGFLPARKRSPTPIHFVPVVKASSFDHRQIPGHNPGSSLGTPTRTDLESAAFDRAWLPRVGPVSLGKAHRGGKNNGKGFGLCVHHYANGPHLVSESDEVHDRDIVDHKHGLTWCPSSEITVEIPPALEGVHPGHPEVVLRDE